MSSCSVEGGTKSCSFKVRVPASICNIGPGFDSLGFAVSLYLEVDVTAEYNGLGTVSVTHCGSGSGSVPLDSSNVIVQAAVITSKKFGAILPSLTLRVNNAIPLGRGLGSSGAARIAGALIAKHACRLPISFEELLLHTSELEGHPDNVTAALAGGCIACLKPNHPSLPTFTRFPLHDKFKFVVVIPEKEKSTVHARTLLPTHYSREDMVFTIQHLSALMVGFITGDTSLFPNCIGDTVHQPYRQTLAPGLSSILELNNSIFTRPDLRGLLGVVISGSGPTVLALCTDNMDHIGQEIARMFRSAGLECSVVQPTLDMKGATVVED
ncbi:homoserine kinase [Pelomyxa schiedti]|nr:homoserine kinase [Pelomyxa schiedti]